MGAADSLRFGGALFVEISFAVQMDIYLILTFEIRRKGYAVAKAVKVPKTNAMRELESAGISYTLHTYEDDGDESVGLGLAISEQLGEEPGQGFKTLVCVTPSNDHIVCCIPVADELDLKAAARAAGEKSLTMMHVKDLLAATGYVRGGCSPVGMKKRYRTLIDETLSLIHI